MVCSWHTFPIRCTAAIMSGYRGTCTVAARHPKCVLVTHSRTRHTPEGDPGSGHCLVAYHARRYAHEPFELILGPLMKCPKCRHENEESAKFCEECATPLGRACAKCGRPLSPTAKFCPGCAHPAALSPEAPATTARHSSPESYTPKHLAEKILTSKADLEGERKQVTVLFADLKGSMELLADRDPEDARKARRSSPHTD